MSVHISFALETNQLELSGNQQWRVLINNDNKLGEGAFGVIYMGEPLDSFSSDKVAIKLEPIDGDKLVLKKEIHALQMLQKCPSVVRYRDCGEDKGWRFVVMDLLGANLAQLSKQYNFDISTTCKIGISVITALESIHELGYLHRDIKPSNFVIGQNYNNDTIYVIDFGLARRFVDNNGRIIPERSDTGFRGTPRYASINSHQCNDLGRRDDMWSVLYMLIEFINGPLPWAHMKDRNEIGELKLQYNNGKLVESLPDEFKSFFFAIESLEFSDVPDYNRLRGLLKSLQVQYHDEGCYPWENNTYSGSSSVSISKSEPISEPNLFLDSSLQSIESYTDGLCDRCRCNIL
eukprot:TRINITY_DN10186_c0_g1_i1.p1 TRINITY_DN10186_c0_g1~~TRINITY_DN10186_c0_g1_i1.p1  ORF type:complete len:348 (-),score=67.78 TRINITY_DN10186_c0_g1_i1:15-1058(-)